MLRRPFAFRALLPQYCCDGQPANLVYNLLGVCMTNDPKPFESTNREPFFTEPRRTWR